MHVGTHVRYSALALSSAKDFAAMQKEPQRRATAFLRYDHMRAMTGIITHTTDNACQVAWNDGTLSRCLRSRLSPV